MRADGRTAGDGDRTSASHSFMPCVTLEHGEDGARQTADRADRQVDLAEQQHEDDADGDHAGGRPS